jgi:dihydropteroate synthase
MVHWQIAGRDLSFDRPLVMGILNVTPDSFSDGGRFAALDDALARAEIMIAEGADIIDVGGESTRPGSTRVDVDQECRRVIPVVAAVRERWGVPVSIDTTKAAVARQAIDSGAEIINDISGLRFDETIADVAAQTGAGLVLMHSRGKFETMHSLPPVTDIVDEVILGLKRSTAIAFARGVTAEQIVVDPGIGFGKTGRQNLELLAKLAKIVAEFESFPVLVGASRKSFIGSVSENDPADKRLGGSVTAAVVSVQMGAKIVRVHDVKETVQALGLAAAIDAQK